MTLELEWYTALGGDVKEFLSSIQEYDMLLGAADDSFLDAGFLKIGKFEGYFVFLDLVTEIYNKSGFITGHGYINLNTESDSDSDIVITDMTF